MWSHSTNEVLSILQNVDEERSRYFNQFIFSNLILARLVRLRSWEDPADELNPLIPGAKRNWFCMDNATYHGEMLTIF